MNELESQINETKEYTLKSVKISQDNLLDKAKKSKQRAVEWFLREQQADGHWVAELESNCTITSEYVFLCQMLGLDIEKRKPEIIKYLFQNQKEDGSWGIAYNHSGDISTTAETYLALRILGLDIQDSRMSRAEKYIRSNGGLEKMRIFTRINFAAFGLFPWEAVPIIPPEFILVPPQSPINIYRLSSWARGTMVPLFIIFHHKPLFALPNGKSKNNPWLDHLWINPANKDIPYSESSFSIIRENPFRWKSFFTAADQVLKVYEKIPLKNSLRTYAVKKCEEWVLQRQEKSGDWAGIFPPMLNGVLALYLNGYGLDSDPIVRGLEAIERFAIHDEQGFRVQACESPVWDTVLGMRGLLDSGVEPKKLQSARNWVESKQLNVTYGDWTVYNPDTPGGGWSFEYENSWYPDVDDTAAVVLAFLLQDPKSKNSECIQRAVKWMVSMQNKDGGWAAFDLNNDKLFLNEIPFSDMDSLCDPSSPDVTGRVLEALGLLNDPAYATACRRGLEYLRNTQEKPGSWFGRWGVNYVYGTSNVLCGLQQLRVTESDQMVQKAISWLKAVQNADGGWGECLESYSDKKLMGKGVSTASQTAWGLLGLLAYLPVTDSAIEKGITWLVQHQEVNQGNWSENEFTGTGFPNHFYLRYHMYRHYFPMMALGRYCSAYSE